MNPHAAQLSSSNKEVAVVGISSDKHASDPPQTRNAGNHVQMHRSPLTKSSHVIGLAQKNRSIADVHFGKLASIRQGVRAVAQYPLWRSFAASRTRQNLYRTSI